MKINKNSTISLGALVAVFGIFTYFQNLTDKKIEKVETKTEKVAEEVSEKKVVDEAQSIYIKTMQDNQKDIQSNQMEIIKALERLK